MKKKVLTVLGTRPEIIRLSVLMPHLDKNFEHRVLFTGQNSQRELSSIFFQELELRSPDYEFACDNSSLSSALSDIFQSVEKVIDDFEPDALVVLGDTNSALSAIVAKRKGVIVYHLEAGNRSFDTNVPEEINRKLVDVVSDFNLVYTDHSRSNLLSEGFESRRVSLSGSPIKEVLQTYKSKIEASSILKDFGYEKNSYFLASFHRQENVDTKERLEELVKSLTELSKHFNRKVLVSTHPRTKQRLETFGLVTENHKYIDFLPPFGYFDFIALQQNAFCVLSDSGSISEEALISGFRAVTIRNSIERPEAIETGLIIMSGLKEDDIISSVSTMSSNSGTHLHQLPAGYEISDFSTRVTNFILSTIHSADFWSGYRRA